MREANKKDVKQSYLGSTKASQRSHIDGNQSAYGKKNSDIMTPSVRGKSYQNVTLQPLESRGLDLSAAKTIETNKAVKIQNFQTASNMKEKPIRGHSDGMSSEGLQTTLIKRNVDTAEEKTRKNKFNI